MSDEKKEKKRKSIEKEDSTILRGTIDRGRNGGMMDYAAMKKCRRRTDCRLQDRYVLSG